MNITLYKNGEFLACDKLETIIYQVQLEMHDAVVCRLSIRFGEASYKERMAVQYWYGPCFRNPVLAKIDLGEPYMAIKCLRDLEKEIELQERKETV